MESTSRTPFVSGTPERSTFAAEPAEPATPLVSFIPAPRAASSAARATPRSWHSLTRSARQSCQLVKNNIGLLLVASSQLFFSLMNIGVKKLNSLDPPVSAVQLILVRMGITWLCCVVYMYLMKVPDPFLGPEGVRFFLLQRGLFGFLGIFGLYYSLQYLSVTDATVLQFLSPMFTAAAGAVFLHEPFSWREGSAGLASLLGVVLIARPEFLFGSGSGDNDVVIPGPPDAPNSGRASDANANYKMVTPSQRLLAVSVALLGAVGAAGVYTTIRHIGKRAHTLHNLVAYSTLCVVVTTISMIAMRIPVVIPTRWDWLLTLLFIGLAGFGGQVLLTLGLQRETAGRGSIAVYGQIVFATFFERVFFHSTPAPLSIVGTIIIIGSALYVALTKKQQSQTHVVASDDPSVGEGLLNSHQMHSGEVEPEDPNAMHPHYVLTPTVSKP
ncbi:hypothetical protein C8Q76DRAFT_706953 [Earliella scabrosa]|nr:hypothetical protein C8Q76DRAFT_706953 [Earliella scabrosa]